MDEPRATSNRIESLDQFRGYTVAGMFLVNFLAGMQVIHKDLPILGHHTVYCSYADTIMPQFFFAVGFAFRLTFGRRMAQSGSWQAYAHFFRRMLGLILVGLVVYTVDRRYFTWSSLQAAGAWNVVKGPLKSEWFQTLVHIAIASLWVLPVIHARPIVRVAYMIFSTLLHAGLTYWFNFEWVYASPGAIDGGPLGFLTWSIPLIVGSLACDAMKGDARGWAIGKMLAWSVVLMGLGYGMSCLTTLYNLPASAAREPGYSPRAASPVVPDFEKAKGREWQTLLAEPPFVPPPPDRPKGDAPDQTIRQLNYWMMSQRVCTPSYLYFGAGFSLAVYVLFVIFCDLLPLRLPMFHSLGTNALAGYVLHGIVDHSVRRFVPGDAPMWYVWCGFTVFFGITYLFIRHLDKSGIYIKM